MEMTGEPREIINGDDADAADFPWMLELLEVDIDPYSDDHRCGASILSERWALTAAHCVYQEVEYNDFDNLRIVVQEDDRTTQSGDEQVVDVERVIIHPEFCERFNSTSAFYDSNCAFSMENDIALIQFASSINLINGAQTIRPAVSNDESLVATLSGWGQTQRGQTYPLQACIKPAADVLQEAELPWATASSCENDPDVLCYGTDTGDPDPAACHGDSGGPLVTHRASGSFEQIGVVSAAIEPCTCLSFAKFTRVSKYADWIRQYVDDPAQAAARNLLLL